MNKTFRSRITKLAYLIETTSTPIDELVKSVKFHHYKNQPQFKTLLLITIQEIPRREIAERLQLLAFERSTQPNRGKLV